MDPIYVYTVIRDYSMYNMCIVNNLHWGPAKLIPADNRENNEYITVCYNRFLATVLEDCWLVFCHEDFMLTGPIEPLLGQADKSAIYGAIGGILTIKRHWLLGEVPTSTILGEITQSDKTGSNTHKKGSAVSMGTIVDTVDCQCVIVHSSLLRKYKLRFDESLAFDLYAEDFCIGAMLKHGILTRILPISCHHFSGGKVAERFFNQLDYLEKKYPRWEAYGSVGYSIGGGRTFTRRVQKLVRKTLERQFPVLLKLLFSMAGK